MVETDSSLDSSSVLSQSEASNRGQKRKSDNVTADEQFFDRLNILCTNTMPNTNNLLNATQHFCMRLAESLTKLPRSVKNKLELEFLHKITEAEELHSNLTQ